MSLKLPYENENSLRKRQFNWLFRVLYRDFLLYSWVYILIRFLHVFFKREWKFFKGEVHILRNGIFYWNRLNFPQTDPVFPPTLFQSIKQRIFNFHSRKASRTINNNRFLKKEQKCEKRKCFYEKKRRKNSQFGKTLKKSKWKIFLLPVLLFRFFCYFKRK